MAIEDELTHAIIGCAMEVHNTRGKGFQEVIYQRALAIELEAAGIQFIREQERTIFYKTHEIGTRRVDFLIEDKVLVELKAVIALEDVHLAQGLNYLTAYNIATGLLINFGAVKLEFRRLFLKKNPARPTLKKQTGKQEYNPNTHNPQDNHIEKSCQSFNPGYPDSDNG